VEIENILANTALHIQVYNQSRIGVHSVSLRISSYITLMTGVQKTNSATTWHSYP
jgi:hypothetical protein